ncbi:MAG TPA: HEAT repeat domain-containing protein [Thermoanaerobaculia bacterium]|nr:HEAT repeat domain-containing protein [Thermoanaerobaculia bacterium]
MSDRDEIIQWMQDDEFGGLPEILSRREEAVPILLDILADRSMPPYMRHRAAVALGETRSRTAVPGLEAAIADEDPVLRLMAARALVKLAGADAVGALLTLAHDPDVSVAKVAVQGLGKVGEGTALAGLERLRAEAGHQLLHNEAEAAIRAIRERIP